MKATLLFTFLCSGLIFAQDKPNTPAKPETKTKIEIFQSRKGGVIIKSFEKVFDFPFYSMIGGKPKKHFNTGGGEAEVWELIDGTSGVKVYGIKIELNNLSSRAGRTETVFLDADEVDAVLKGVDYILGYQSDKTKYKDWQVDFKSKAGFKISAFSTSKSTLYAVQAGTVTHILPRAGIEGLKEAFTKAKGLLGE
jgi:hypothetical protein